MARFMRFVRIFNDEEEGDELLTPSKVYLPRKNLLNTLSDRDLYRRFRFDRDSIMYICDIVRDEIAPKSSKGGSISVEIQVLACLSYLATNKFQLSVADDLNIAQQSVSHCIRRVTKALASKAGQFIYFTRNEQERRNSTESFYSIGGFPNVIGLIDCTHIRIQSPPLAVEREYVNRKSYHSINVQAIVDHRGRFINIVANWPGSSHDSFILRHSKVWDAFESGQKQGIILGDNGYPNRAWLMTPFINPTTRGEKKYNTAHSKTRVGVEQAFGRWKRRFHTLHGEVRISLELVSNLIVAAAVLQNIAIERSQPDFEDDFIDSQLEPQNEHGENEHNINTYRNAIVENFFSDRNNR